jgi:ABC-type xylose transport system permease subunit
MTVEYHEPRVGLRALWFGLLAGPVVWSLLSIANYALDAQSCRPAGMELSRPVYSAVRPLAGILTLIGIAIVVAALVVAARSRKRSADANTPHDAVWSRVHFMALAGIITSAVFLEAIVLHGIGVIVIPACT